MSGKLAKNSNNHELNNIIDRLVKTYKPLEIYLYGSYAWGKPDKDSDIDLFIIVNETELDMAERIRLGLRNLRGIVKPIDLRVFTKREKEEKYQHPSTLTHKIINEGIKLYGSP